MAKSEEETPIAATIPPVPKSDDAPADDLQIESPPPPSRFRLWYALTVFSAVSLIAFSTETDSQEWRAEEKWVLSVTLLSLVLSSLASLAHIGLREAFVGMPLEGLLLFTELGFWVGGLIVMMDTNNRLAVDSNGRILNVNLYFFSWASLITTVALLVGYAQQVTARDISNAGYWAGIFVSSLVTLVSSSQIYAKGVTLQGQEFVCRDGDEDHGSGFCERLKFSLALGVISLCVAGAFGMLSLKLSTAVNASASFSMLFAWAVGVALVTFGDRSPGNEVGNLYFACWTAFVLSLFMVSTSIKNFVASRTEAAEKEDQEDKVEIPSSPSSDTEKAEEVRSKPDEEADATTLPEGLITPTSISAVKGDQSDLEVPSDEIVASTAPVLNINIPIPRESEV